MTLREVDDYLEEKIKQDENHIVFTFYELRIKLDLSEEEAQEFLRLVSTKLENTSYKVYKTGQEYEYKLKKVKVKDNELLVAVK